MGTTMKLTVEIERETDGRWLADVAEIPGAAAYGKTQEEAVHNAISVAFVALDFELTEGQLLNVLGKDAPRQ